MAGAMRRLAQPSLPTELLLKVIEPLVESQLPFCSITESDKLKVIIGKYFVWPHNIANGTRKLLLQTATRAFFKLSRVKLPGDLGPTLPILGAMKTRLRRLVLDIQSTPRDSAIYSVLNNLTNTMSSLAKLFPRLSICVCLIHFTEGGQVKPRVPRQSFEEAILEFHNLKQAADGSGWVTSTLEHTLVEFIDAFARSGSGARKLIRFSNGYKGLGAMTGPLVEVHKGEPVIANAERIFSEAYWGSQEYRSALR